MTDMETRVTPATSKSGGALATLYGWALTVLLVLGATHFVGAIALMVFSVVAGVVLIVTGVRARGWPRPVLIVLGLILVALPVFLYIDVVTGSFDFTVR